MQLPVQKNIAQLPDGYCPADYQEFNEAIMAAEMFVELGAVGFILQQPTPPDETIEGNTDAVWIKTDANSAPIRAYKWSTTINGGSWISPHPVPPGSKELRMWEGTPDELTTYEGGEAGAVDPASGPFWEIAADMTGRLPIGVNSDVDSGAPPVDETVPQYGLGDINTGSAEDPLGSVLISVDQLPVHSHPVGFLGGGSNPGDNPLTNDNLFVRGVSPVINLSEWGQGSVSMYRVTGTNNNDTTIVSFNGVNVLTYDVHSNAYSNREPERLDPRVPIKAVYFIRRTARQYYSEIS
jgi:hypothetical protein